MLEPRDAGRTEFSVVIPAFNAEATVASSVASVLRQTRADLEVIVVDDGSMDGTAAAVERLTDQRVKLISRPKRGVSAARNAGIDTARGRYIAFLDSDDLWLPRYLELAAEALASTARPGFVYTDAYAFDPVTGKVGRRGMVGRQPPVPPPSDRDAFLLELLERNFVHVSTSVPRAVLEEVGGFDPDSTMAEDYALWLRIIVRGYDVAWVPGKHVLYRVHADQASRDEVKMRRGDLVALAAIEPGDLPPPPTASCSTGAGASSSTSCACSRVAHRLPGPSVGFVVASAGCGRPRDSDPHAVTIRPLKWPRRFLISPWFNHL